MRCVFAVGLLASLVAARSTNARAVSTTVCAYHEITEGGKNVSMHFDHPDVGLIVAVKVAVVSPEYSEYTYANGKLALSATSVPDAHCAYTGSAQNAPLAGVSLFTCGANGPRVTIAFSNSTVLQLKKVSDLGNVDGSYAMTVIDDTGDPGETDHPIDVRDYENITKRSLRSLRSLLLVDDVAVLYFDYVFVSDHTRFTNYGGDEDAVKADTIDEIAFVNAMYLVGDRFTPQIQFRIKTQIVWTERPPQLDPTNVGTDFDAHGEPQYPANGPQMHVEFKRWIFETTFFDFTAYSTSGSGPGDRDPFDSFLVSGPAFELGQGVGWHLLSGEFSFKMSSGFVSYGFTFLDSVCRGHDATVWQNGCQQLYETLDTAIGLSWKNVMRGFTAGSLRCVPNMAAGISSMLNTPVHGFPGLILAHELGHDLGFRHVYNDAEVIDDCLRDHPHDGSAVMGHDSPGESISWSQCSVNTFRSNYERGFDRVGVASAFGVYSCAKGAKGAPRPLNLQIAPRFAAELPSRSLVYEFSVARSLTAVQRSVLMASVA